MTDHKLLSGSLRRVSLADVFNLLGGNNFSGILNLRSQYSEYMGIIYFLNGNPINGYYGDLKGLDAIYALFGWTDGNYEFYEQALTQIETVIKQSRMQIVLNALRMLDDGELVQIGPLAPQPTEKRAPEVEEKKVVQPVKESSEHVCAGCNTFLFENDTKVFIANQEYCFQCAMTRAHSVDGGAYAAASRKKKPVEDAFKNEPQKVTVFKDKDLKNDSSAKAIAPKDNASRKETTKVVALKNNKIENSVPKNASAIVISQKDSQISDIDVSDGDKRSINNISTENNFQGGILFRLKKMGPFKISVMASMVMVWVVLGILFFSKFNSSSQTAKSATQATSSSAINSTNTEQMKTAQVAVPITAVADSQNVAPSQPVKTAQTSENKSAQNNSSTLSQSKQSSTSIQTTTASQPTETKSASAPVEKPVEKSVNAATTRQENPPEKSDTPKTVVKETETIQTSVAKNEVKEVAPEPVKAVSEASKAPEKTEAPKPVAAAPTTPATAAPTTPATAAPTTPATVASATPATAAPATPATVTSATPATAAPIKQAVIKQPEFPGGKTELAKWLSSHINFPNYAATRGTEGYVVVELTIEPNGKISKQTIVQSLQKHCDQEVLRVVSKMPNWKPAEKNGVAVSGTYMLSVKFAQK
jgi:TonB family protein